MREVTKESLEKSLKDFLKTAANSLNANDIMVSNKNKFVDGVESLIGTVVISIKSKIPEYKLEKRLKYFKNYFYKRVKEFKGVQV